MLKDVGPMNALLQPVVSPCAPSPAGRILIVDDVADNRAVLARRFLKRGYSVVEADCGAQALRCVEEATFDVVLLDVMMPDIQGTEVLRSIRFKFSSATLPVIMVTAKTQPEDIVESLKLGANDYLTKPVEFSVALARVEIQIERRRAEQEIRNYTGKLLEANARIQEEMRRRMASERKNLFLALHDVLTGLPNRHTFGEKLKAAHESAKTLGEPLSVFFVDLDGFKAVNDTQGHAVGDDLLRDVAARLAGAVGPLGFIARLGGDEFGVIDSVAPPAELAARIVETIGREYCISGQRVFVGASVGVSFFNGQDDPETLVKQADLAMFCAKAEGGHAYRMFDPEMGRQADDRQRLEADLRNALKNRELYLHYQPIVDLVTGRTMYVEALLRWRHPIRGETSPADFIPLAEARGLISSIGNWVLEEGCRAVMRHRQEGIGVSINVSPNQFRDNSIIPGVIHALAESGLPASKLILEITEGLLLRDDPATQRQLEKLRSLGVRVALDDFGAGFSALRYMRSFTFDIVKMDRSFIAAVAESAETEAIVKAIMDICRALKLTFVAEGVEVISQAQRLAALGCDFAQGYYFARPGPLA